jgi:ABC-type nitrate/sulfonate/bicarbonate transport system substrate-binding protein
MIAGLQQSVIDGFCLSSPSADIAVSRAGCAYLFDMALNPPPEFSAYCYIIASASERSLKEKREPLLRYVAGLALALRAIKADPAAFKAFAVPFLELDPAIAERAFASNSKIYFDAPVPDGALYQQNLDMVNLVNRTQGLDRMPIKLTYDYVFDHDLAAEAMQRL